MRGGKHVGLPRLAYRLHHHVGVHHHRPERQRDQLPPQGHTPYSDYGRVVAEQGYALRREQEAEHAADDEERRADAHDEPISLAHPCI